ncbi:Methyltransferase domain [Teratosphaeria destructans]|uniref:Methyltransferase domain n=1 Tax=Teratosphaeria destructans TaxID=418781 RepID=A0A9W7SPK7_9PEZI|nr:Methyltransferase domain [Teratosphaeria destructans]
MTEQSQPTTSQTDYTKRWWARDAGVTDKTRHLLEQYSKIPADQVETHIRTLQDKASKVHPYPCIGSWRFLEWGLKTHPLYECEILPRMLTGDEILLDMGCAIAQDIRWLVSDGVDSSRTYGGDLRLDYLDIGFEMFRDRDTLKTKFIQADIMDPENALFGELGGRVDILVASAFLHLFTYDVQKRVAMALAKLLKPQKDSLIVGRQMGSFVPGEYKRRDDDVVRYRHDVESWKRFWEEIGEETGVEYAVEAELLEIEKHLRPERSVGETEDNSGRMTFSVRRMN